MLVRAIQLTHNSQTNFKAYFVNDTNGYFKQLWYNAQAKNSEQFCKLVDEFTKQNTDHALEIVSKQHYNYDIKKFFIFNHKNGVCEGYTCKNDLTSLIEALKDDNKLYKTNTITASIYQKLTGQNVRPENKKLIG